MSQFILLEVHQLLYEKSKKIRLQTHNQTSGGLHSGGVSEPQEVTSMIYPPY